MYLGIAWLLVEMSLEDSKFVDFLDVCVLVVILMETKGKPTIKNTIIILALSLL